MDWRRRLVATSILMAVIAVIWSAAEQRAATAQTGGGQRSDSTVAVTVQAVALTPPRTRIQSIGTGKAMRSVDVVADVAGTVEELNVQPNKTVEEGEALVTLDRDTQKFLLDSATAELEKQEASFSRYQTLIDQNSTNVSQAQLDEARASLALARAQVAEAQHEYDRRVIRAPFSGRINLNDLTVGTYLPVGAGVVTLVDASRLFVEFTVPETAVGSIKIGLPVRLFTPALRGLVFDGDVVAFDSAIDAELRTIRVRAEVKNSDYVLLPGMTFSVQVAIGEDPLPVVPAVSILWNRDGAYVWRLDADQKPERVAVIIRQREGDRVWVESNLAAGDRVVVDGAFKLNEDSEVAVTDA